MVHQLHVTNEYYQTDSSCRMHSKRDTFSLIFRGKIRKDWKECDSQRRVTSTCVECKGERTRSFFVGWTATAYSSSFSFVLFWGSQVKWPLTFFPARFLFSSFLFHKFLSNPYDRSDSLFLLVCRVWNVSCVSTPID